MRVNVDKVLERDQKLSELDDRADALQAGASQFESSAAKLKRKYWWKNCKVNVPIPSPLFSWVSTHRRQENLSGSKSSAECGMVPHPPLAPLLGGNLEAAFLSCITLAGHQGTLEYSEPLTGGPGDLEESGGVSQAAFSQRTSAKFLPVPSGDTPVLTQWLG